MRYEKLGNAIKVRLNNTYEVVSLYEKGELPNEYNISFYLKNSTVDILDLMDNCECTIKADNFSIKTEITRYIENAYKNGQFSKYFDKYDYLMKCFDKGNEILSEA